MNIELFLPDNTSNINESGRIRVILYTETPTVEKLHGLTVCYEFNRKMYHNLTQCQA